MRKEYEPSKLDMNVNLVKALGRRNLKDLFDSKCSYILKKYGEKNLKNIDEEIEDYLFGLEKVHRLKMQLDFYYYNKIDIEKDLFKVDDLFLTGILIHMINLSQASRVYLSYDQESNAGKISNIFLDGIPEETYKNLIENIKQRSEICYILLKVYYLLHKAYIESENHEDFYNFKEFYFTNFFKLPKNISLDMVTSISNVILMSSFPLKIKNQELYELYEFQKKNDMILSFAGNLNDQQFYGYAKILFNCEKLDELTGYVKEFENYIIDEHKTDSLNFARSLIAFLKSDFEKSLELLSTIKFVHYGMKLRVKVMSLILFYELNSFESFLSGYDSLKHFLKYTEPGQENIKKKYIRKGNVFCDCIKKLFIMKNDPDVTELELLKKEVIGNIPEHQSWFEKKISELSLDKGNYSTFSYKKTGSLE